MIKALYTFIAYPLMLLSFKLLASFNPKIKQGFELRKSKAWLKGNLKSGLPVYWFHVASGEFEYAKPVIRELKKQPCQILVTYFSPSVLNSLKNTPEVDIYVPSPWDTPWNWQEFINKFKPKVLAISRTDLWPQMIWQAEKNKIPSLLFSATLPSHSARVASFWGRLFYSFVTASLTEISCVTDEDKESFLKICQTSKVSTDGDTRFDQVFHRLETSQAPEEIRKRFPHREKVFIAGSTWPEDEEILLPAFKNLIQNDYKIILAPHEVDGAHLNKIKTQLMLHKISDADLYLVDRVGILAQLYPLATTAFVGGSFKKSVHSVMEPAAAGCFTLVGPFHFNSREALLLKSKGFVKEVLNSSDIQKAVEGSKPSVDEIRSFMKSQKGVSQKTAEKISSLN